MSGLLLLCTKWTLFCSKSPENCIYLNQSELSNFFMYLIRAEIIRLIWSHKYDFRKKLHDTRFNYHFITSILKSPKNMTWLVQIFCWCSTELVWSIYPFFGEKIRVLETKVAKFATWYSLSFIFLQFDWLF